MAGNDTEITSCALHEGEGAGKDQGGALEDQVQALDVDSKPTRVAEELKTQHEGSSAQPDATSPAEVVPSANAGRRVRTSDPIVGVDLLIGQSGVAAEKPVTVPTLLKDSVSKTPDRAALCYKEGGSWKEITYSEYYRLCVATAKSFLKVEF